MWSSPTICRFPPDVVAIQADKGSVAVSGQQVVVTIGEVAPGEVIDIHIQARVNAQATSDGGSNGVTLVTSNDSDDPRNNVSNVFITIEMPPASPIPLPTELPTPLPTEAPPTAFTPEPTRVSARLRPAVGRAHL